MSKAPAVFFGARGVVVRLFSLDMTGS